jgi:hypothetical protein
MTNREPFRARLQTVNRLLVVFFAVVCGFFSSAEAAITKIVITRVESPTFEGMTFGAVGRYEKLVGRAYGEVDPTDPRNSVIADMALAARNARGMVEYVTDVYILRPIDPSRGNHRLFYEINNRGANLSFGQLNDATTGGNNPTTAADAGNGFLMRQGYTMLWSGWDVTVVPNLTTKPFTITVPVATQADGSSIVGPALEEFVIDNTATMAGPLTYPAATLDKSQASLTVRVQYSDPPTSIPSTGWEFVNARTIRLLPAGTPFEKGRLYEFTYPAKDPLVAGLGFASVRDLATFLHHADTDDDGTPNPLSGRVHRVYSFGVSQPARFMHDFLFLGFNQDEEGRQVFDGTLNWIGGASRGFFNYRFAQPGRTHRQHIARWYPERQFPFANETTFDPVTGKTGGVLRSCLSTGTCPRIMEVNSENEYWAKAGSLLHTDTSGNDLAALSDVRYYMLSSLPHSTGIGPTGPGICQQPRNPLVANRPLRALLVALDEWVSHHTQPPQSELPRRSNHTLVPSLPQSVAGFPDIPGVTYNGRLHEGGLLDFGPLFDQGILTILPPTLLGSPYPALVPKTDVDGNDIAGVRLPDVAVPIATYTGWGLRARPAAGDGCDAAGQQIDFPRTKADREATGDPRPSIEERYRTHDAYVKKVTRAARQLGRRRLLLEEDVQRYVAEAEASGVGR